MTGLLVPAITRRWQDRQKELEIKAELVSELSEAIMQMVMAVQFARLRAELAASQPAAARTDNHQQEFDEAYFAQTTIPSNWTVFSGLVTPAFTPSKD